MFYIKITNLDNGYESLLPTITYENQYNDDFINTFNDLNTDSNLEYSII